MSKRIMTRTVSCCILALPAIAAPAGAQAGGVEGTALGATVNQLVVLAEPPGKKDLPQVIGPLLFGYALWDTSEERGGYFGAIGELDDPAAACPSDAYDVLDSQGQTTPLSEIQGTIHEYLFERSWAQFSYVNDSIGTLTEPNDFTDAFGLSGIRFFAAQNPLFAPLKVQCGTSGSVWAPYDYPGLTGKLVSATGHAALSGVRVAQNIGFANNLAFPAGEYDFNVSFPLMTKHDLVTAPPFSDPAAHSPDPFDPRQPFVVQLPLWGPLWLADAPPSGSPPSSYAQVVMNLVHPEVAALVRASIEQRVDPANYATGLPAYYVVGGEFVIAGPPNLDEAGNFAEVPAPVAPPLTPDTYLNHLPDTDYSDHSYGHFRKWLARHYPGDATHTPAEQLAAAWGWPALASCPNLESCTTIDPIAAAGNGGTPPASNLQAVFDDWTAFQDDQTVDALDFQYRVAKSALPGEPTPMACDSPSSIGEPPPMMTLQFSITGAERGARHSDGLAFGNWYADNDRRLDLLTPMKLRALHAVTTGEPLTFPFFGMPRDEMLHPPASISCENPFIGHDPEAPYTFRVPCWDYEFSNRTLREMIALGLDSLGLAYWEAPTIWAVQPGNYKLPPPPPPPPPLTNVPPVFDPGAFTIHGGSFGGSDGNIAETMAAEVSGLETSRAFMTPWRSPLLVYVGGAAKKATDGSEDKPYHEGPTLDVINVLCRGQAQFAPYSDLEALDDLWVAAQRKILLVPFVPQLDASDVSACLESAKEHGWLVIVLSTFVQPNGKDVLSIVPAPLSPPVALLALADAGGLFAQILKFETPVGGSPVPWFIVAVPAAKLPGALSFFDTNSALAAGLDSLVTRPIRPVLAVPTTLPCPSNPGATSVSGIDLNVMTDGINLLVSVANVSGMPQCFDLKVDPRLHNAVVTEHVLDGGPFIDVGLFDADALGSVLSYVRAVIPAIAGVTVSEVAVMLDGARSDLEDRCNEGYDTSAAQALVEALDDVIQHDPGSIEKMVAGLVRLERTPLLAFDESTSELWIAHIDGTLVTDADVQVELPLQHHARRSGFTAGPTGSYVLDVTVDPDEEVWDLELEDYVIPMQVSGKHLVEIHAQDHTTGTHSVLLVDLSP